MPTFDLNRQIVQKAEKHGFKFALSMIKLRGYGGETEHWDYALESFTLMAGLAAVTDEHAAVRIGGDADAAPGDGGADGGDDRLDRAGPLRHQHRGRLEQERVRADGRVAG